MTTRREFLKTSAAAAVAGGLLPYAARAPAAVTDGGTLTVALYADPRTLDPHLAGSLQGRATTQAIHDTLLEVDGNGHLVPGLVESWEWKDDRTVVLTTRTGVRFHDGTDFDAEAVRYNLERIRNPDTGSIRGGEISVLDTVEVVDAEDGQAPSEAAVRRIPVSAGRRCRLRRVSDRARAVGSGVRPASGGHRPVQGHRIPQGRPHDTGAQRGLLECRQAASRPCRAPARPGRQHPPCRAALGRCAACGIAAAAGHSAPARGR